MNEVYSSALVFSASFFGALLANLFMLEHIRQIVSGGFDEERRRQAQERKRQADAKLDRIIKELEDAHVS